MPGQQQPESETMQPCESQSATAQLEQQQAGPSTSSNGHEYQQVEHAAAGSSEPNELLPGPQARGDDGILPGVTKQPASQHASPDGEPMPGHGGPEAQKAAEQEGQATCEWLGRSETSSQRIQPGWQSSAAWG